MENKTLIDGLKAELAMRQNEYTLAIDQAIERLQQAKGRAASTHLGHNLANNATELSTIAAKIEMVSNTIRWAEQEAK